MKQIDKNIEYSTEQFELGAEELKNKHYVLRLYVAGSTPRSKRAIVNVKKICEEYLKDRYKLEVIDLYQKPNLAKGEQIVAVPTLMKKLPPPLRRIIGDMADLKRVLIGLDLQEIKKK